MERKYFKINDERVLFTQLEEEGVLYDLEKNQYLNLNETFCIIFKCLQDGFDLVGIRDKLMEEYEVSEENCEKQILKAINELLEKGFIHVQNSSEI